MKMSFHRARHKKGFVLFFVLILLGISLVILAGNLYRANTVANLNQRNSEYLVCSRAAESAVEKVYGSMANDFQSYAVAGVSSRLTTYPTNIPNEISFWTNFTFFDPATGTAGRTYVQQISNYSGSLPSAYVGLFTTNAPVYRIISNVQKANSSSGVVGTAQEDVLLALVPLTTWAIFYNGLLEFSDCATMTVNGRVHANGPIYVGGPDVLTFKNPVTTTSTFTSPANVGLGPWTSNNWNVVFNTQPGYTTNVASVTSSLNMTNAHFQIDIPPAGENSMSTTGQERLYNKAQMILLVTNSSTVSTNVSVRIILQDSTDGGLTVPGADTSKDTNSFAYANISSAGVSTNLPFLTLTNSFLDQRENTTNLVTQIDVGQFSKWASTNNAIYNKFLQYGRYPTILYVADQRTKTAKNLAVVRLSDAAQLPSNGGMGFTVATQNPLYTWSDYNIKTSSGSMTGSNNLYEVPAALLSDSLTILSSGWTDSESWTAFSTGNANDNASNTTVNAAIVTGTVASTDTSATGNSGGVHNLPRLLEDWGGCTLYLNTSILRLWDSKMATNQFRMPNATKPYYSPPTRTFSFDTHFLDPSKYPQGIPLALVPIRFAWAVPPPGVTNLAVTHN